jgi:chemotaxis protein methyltransferase CheR
MVANNPVPTITEHELTEIRSLIERRTGILFDASRERFLSTRVRDHLQSKRLAHGTELLRVLRGSNAEYDAFLERLLTQETSFFRYPDVFDALEKKVLPEIHIKKFWENPRTLRVWSAGCATGEEPYSVAITLAEALEFADAWDIRILASDISRQALQHAERGVYPSRSLQGLSSRRIENWFVKVGDQFMIKPRIRNMVAFAPMNLSDAPYMGRFDLIFCMNVLIYFSEEKRSALIQRFYEWLEPGGCLFLGHAESLANSPVKFQTNIHREARIYQKPPSSVAFRAKAGEVKS